MVTLQRAIELAQIDYHVSGPVQEDPEYVAYKQKWAELGGWGGGADLQGIRRALADAEARGRTEWNSAWRRQMDAIWNRELAVFDPRFREWRESVLIPRSVDEALKTVYIMQVGYAANDFPSPHHAGSIYDHDAASEELVNLNKAGFVTFGGQAARGKRREAQRDFDQRAYLAGAINVSLLPYFCDELDRKYTLFVTQGGDKKSKREGVDGGVGEFLSESIKIRSHWWTLDWHHYLGSGDLWYDDVPGVADALNRKTAHVMIVAPWEEQNLWGDIMSALLRAYARREAKGRTEHGIKFTRTRMAPQVVRFRPF